METIQRSVSRRFALAAAFCVLVLLVLVIALFSHHWFLHHNDAGLESTHTHYGLLKVEVSRMGVMEEFDYDELEEKAPLTPKEIVPVASATRSIFIVGIILVLAYLGMSLAAARDMMPEWARRIAVYVGFGAGVALLVASLYFMLAFPTALNVDDAVQGVSATVGGMPYLVLFGGVILLLVAEVTRRAPEEIWGY